MVVFHVLCAFGFVLQFKLEKGETFMLYISMIWSFGFVCQKLRALVEREKRDSTIHKKRKVFLFFYFFIFYSLIRVGFGCIGALGFEWFLTLLLSL
jgi:hypothetical protein